MAHGEEETFIVAKVHLTELQKRIAPKGERGPRYVVINAATGTPLTGTYTRERAAQLRADQENDAAEVYRAAP